MSVLSRIIQNILYVLYGVLIAISVSEGNIMPMLICTIVIIAADGYLEHYSHKVKESEWVKSNPFTDTIECKKCGFNICDEELKSDYCPNCGAKMKNPYEL